VAPRATARAVVLALLSDNGVPIVDETGVLPPP
jgi:hypothetical protein